MPVTKINFKQQLNAPTFYVGTGGHYQTIQAAIDALPAGGGIVCLLDATYTITTPILIKQSNTVIMGNNKTSIITGDNNLVSPFVKANGAGYNNCMLVNLQMIGSNASPLGTAIDFSTFNLSKVDNVYIYNFNTAVNADDKNGTGTNTNTTFYNTFERVQAFTVVNGIVFKDLANHNFVNECRFAVVGNATPSIGADINNCQGISITNTSFEPASILNSIGVQSRNNTIGLQLDTCWIEGNTTGVKIDTSGTSSSSVSIRGGTISANTTNISDPNGVIEFVNTPVEYAKTTVFRGFKSQILNQNPQAIHGAEVIIDSTTNTVHGFYSHNNNNYAHSGDMNRSEFMNGSDSGVCYNAIQRGTGKAIRVSDGTTETFSVDKSGNIISPTVDMLYMNTLAMS